MAERLDGGQEGQGLDLPGLSQGSMVVRGSGDQWSGDESELLGAVGGDLGQPNHALRAVQRTAGMDVSGQGQGFYPPGSNPWALDVDARQQEVTLRDEERARLQRETDEENLRRHDVDSSRSVRKVSMLSSRRGAGTERSLSPPIRKVSGALNVDRGTSGTDEARNVDRAGHVAETSPSSIRRIQDDHVKTYTWSDQGGTRESGENK